MKKILVVLFMCILLTGCSLKTSKNEEYKLNGYGKYQIPNNAVIRKDHSSSRKLFFVKNKDLRNKMPNNISVEGGTNRYSKEDHMQFKSAIQSQLYMQASRFSSKITGSGTKTKNGYTLYIFNMENSGSITKQYYIVGDYKYILVHETILNGTEDKELDNIAKYIIDSFIWE